MAKTQGQDGKGPLCSLITQIQIKYGSTWNRLDVQNSKVRSQHTYRNAISTFSTLFRRRKTDKSVVTLFSRSHILPMWPFYSSIIMKGLKVYILAWDFRKGESIAKYQTRKKNVAFNVELLILGWGLLKPTFIVPKLY